MAAIADMVQKSNYDIVLLQEVWSMRDYVSLSCKILDKLPYCHYFHSGFVGGGLCMFSKYPIMETMFYNYPLNGHAHKIFHGDWYGSKGCGLAIVKVKDMTINVYITHMHARYNHVDEFDEYAAHRATQSFGLSQFVKHTSKACDAVILAGDFNTTPTELAYRVIRSNACVNDAWIVKHQDGGSGGYTCDMPDNSFTPHDVTAKLPHGQRIDYIFYRSNNHIKLESCEVLCNKIPNNDFDYSDHQPVVAQMTIKKNITANQVPLPEASVQLNCVKELITIVDKGLSKARYNKYFYFVTMLLSLMVLLLCRERYVGDSGRLHVVLEILQGMMAIFSAMSLWISAVVARCEQNAFLGQKTDLENLLKGAALGKLSKQD